MNADWITWLFVFLRASALLLVFPVFSGGNFPVQLRVATAALGAYLILPVTAMPRLADLSLLGIIGLMVKEGCVGLLLGFVSRLVYYGMDLAGNFIASQIGLIFTPDQEPFTGTQTQAPGLMLYFLGAMILLSLDLHHWLLVAFQRSYDLLPIGAAHGNEALMMDVIQRSSRVFVVAVQLSAPVLAVSFVVSLTFAVLGRAVPQMNVFTESFGIRILVGLIVFGLTTSLTAQHIANFLRHMPEDIMQVVHLLGSA